MGETGTCVGDFVALRLWGSRLWCIGGQFFIVGTWSVDFGVVTYSWLLLKYGGNWNVLGILSLFGFEAPDCGALVGKLKLQLQHAFFTFKICCPCMLSVN